MRIHRRRLLLLLLLLHLPCVLPLPCTQIGCDSSRSNIGSGALADDHAPPVVERLLRTGGAGAAVAHPVLVSGDASGVLVALPCDGNVTAWRRGWAGGAGWWCAPGACGGGAALTGVQGALASESADGVRLVLVLQLAAGGGSGQAWGLDLRAVNATPGRAAVLLTPAWGPVALAGGCGPLLALAGGAVFAAGSGGLLAIAPASGALTPLLPAAALECGGLPDAPAAGSGPVLVPAALGLLLVLQTSRGCLLATPSSGPGAGSVLWRVATPAVWSPSSVSGGMPAADDGGSRGGGRVYATSADGWLCCYDAGAEGAVCRGGWAAAGGRCVQLVNPAGAAVALTAGGGLALSPASVDFHGGAVYTVDSGGYVYAVGTTSAALAVTAAPMWGADAGGLSAGTPPTPLLVPNGFALGWHALLLTSSSGRVLALSVGDVGPTGDDDDYGATDDDGGVTVGVVWQLQLPLDGGAPWANISAAALSLTPEGRLLLPLAAGGVAVVGAAADPIEDEPTAVVYALIAAGATTAGALAIALVAAARVRAAGGRSTQARALIRAAFLLGVAEGGHVEGGEEQEEEDKRRGWWGSWLGGWKRLPKE